MHDTSHARGAASLDTCSQVLDAVSLGASLTVDDLEASLAWYRDVFGCEVHQRYERDGVLFAVAMKAGAVKILLTRDNGAQGTDRAKGQGFSLMLTTSQDIDAIAARIKAAGGVLESEPADLRGMRAFRLKDPDGFRLVISSPQLK